MGSVLPWLWTLAAGTSHKTAELCEPNLVQHKVGPLSARGLLAFNNAAGCRAEPMPLGAHMDHDHTCLNRPHGQAEECAQQLNASNSWPSASATASTQAAFLNKSVLMIGDSTLANKARALSRVYCAESICQSTSGTPGFCFHHPHERAVWDAAVCSPGHANCSVEEKVRNSLNFGSGRPVACGNSFNFTNRTDFDAIIFNAGMHFVSSLYRTRLTFTQYMAELDSCVSLLTAQYPRAKRLYMLTNNVCTSAWRDDFARNALRMVALTESLDPDYNMQWSDVGVVSVRVAEREVARRHGWRLIDPHTADHCACSGLRDGRHFVPLVPNFLRRIASELARA